MKMKYRSFAKNNLDCEEFKKHFVRKINSEKNKQLIAVITYRLWNGRS